MQLAIKEKTRLHLLEGRLVLPSRAIMVSEEVLFLFLIVDWTSPAVLNKEKKKKMTPAKLQVFAKTRCTLTRIVKVQPVFRRQTLGVPPFGTSFLLQSPPLTAGRTPSYHASG